MEAIATRAIASRLEAIACRVEAIASRLEAIARRFEAIIATRLEAIRLGSEPGQFSARVGLQTVQVLELGRGPSGKRIKLRAATGEEGTNPQSLS